MWRLAIPLALGALLPGCHTAAPATGGRLTVVAAEDVWGSIARQLAGDGADVRSLVANPDADPHDHEPTASDARAVAAAAIVITNGIGYDPWVDNLLAADASSRRIVVKVGAVVGLKEGDNPHQWYSPDAVDRVVSTLVDDLRRADPSHAADYDRHRAAFETALAPYRAAVARLRARFAGTPIGATESVVTPLATSLGLDVLTPDSFLDAVSEGIDPSAADKATVDRQIRSHAVRALVYNTQNATPDVRRLVDEAKAAGVPVVPITETLTPKGATFQDWQTRQLDALADALATATGR